MYVFFEGVDGSGKTTTIDKLFRVLNASGHETIKVDMNEFRGKPNEEYELLDRFQSSQTIVLFDRSVITDMVYRLVDGGTRNGIDLYQALKYLTGSKIVYCKTYTSYKDALKRGDDNVPDKKVHNERSKTYDTLLALFKTFTNAQIIHYNWRMDSFSDLVETILH